MISHRCWKLFASAGPRMRVRYWSSRSIPRGLGSEHVTSSMYLHHQIFTYGNEDDFQPASSQNSTGHLIEHREDTFLVQEKAECLACPGHTIKPEMKIGWEGDPCPSCTSWAIFRVWIRLSQDARWVFREWLECSVKITNEPNKLSMYVVELIIVF